eukprot:418950-Prymnesium_polylepis.1
MTSRAFFCHTSVRFAPGSALTAHEMAVHRRGAQQIEDSRVRLEEHQVRVEARVAAERALSRCHKQRVGVHKQHTAVGGQVPREQLDRRAAAVRPLRPRRRQRRGGRCGDRWRALTRASARRELKLAARYRGRVEDAIASP